MWGTTPFGVGDHCGLGAMTPVKSFLYITLFGLTIELWKLWYLNARLVVVHTVNTKFLSNELSEIFQSLGKMQNVTQVDATETNAAATLEETKVIFTFLNLLSVYFCTNSSCLLTPKTNLMFFQGWYTVEVAVSNKNVMFSDKCL